MYQQDDYHPEAEFQEEIDEQVNKFTKEICEWIYDRFPDKPIEVDEELITNASGTQKARRMSLRTDLGLVIIMPNFAEKKNPTASAMVINLGIARAMHLEGFDAEFIEREGRIYSNPIPYKPSTVEVLGYYLTHKVTTGI